MCKQKHFEQNVRLMIVRDLLQLNQGSDADFIIKQATALSEFVLDGADGFIRAQSLNHDKAKQKTNTTALCQLYVLAH